MSMSYDYIIAGGGCAGLSLAYHLNRSQLRGARILILDAEPKNQNDKTWCFWTEEELPFACTQQTAWQEVEFIGPGRQLTQCIDPFRYVFVNSLAFYQETTDELKANPNIEFRYEKVQAVEDLPEGSRVTTDRGSYTARWTFNSIIFPQARDPQRFFYLNQHFGGWFVKTEEPIFNPDRMRMMDFRLPQDGEVRFVYILPFSEYEALVEYTVFSEHTWKAEAYDQALQAFIEEYLATGDYEITHRERGCIPMTNHPFAAQAGEHVLNLGTAAGLTKPTTGYTFLNIQRDVQAIVKSLETTGRPLRRHRLRARSAFYDQLLLFIIRNQGGQVSRIFERLFHQNDFRTILRFLDEQTHIWEELPILGRLPWAPFLMAIWRYKILGRMDLRSIQEQAAALSQPKTTES